MSDRMHHRVLGCPASLFFVIRGDEYQVRTRLLTALGRLELEEARICNGLVGWQARHCVVKPKRRGFCPTRVFLSLEDHHR